MSWVSLEEVGGFLAHVGSCIKKQKENCQTHLRCPKQKTEQFGWVSGFRKWLVLGRYPNRRDILGAEIFFSTCPCLPAWLRGKPGSPPLDNDGSLGHSWGNCTARPFSSWRKIGSQDISRKLVLDNFLWQTLSLTMSLVAPLVLLQDWDEVTAKLAISFCANSV